MPERGEAASEHLSLGDHCCDLDLVVNGHRFRTHTAVVAQDSELIRSWLESPLIAAQACNKSVVLNLQLPEIRLPSHLQAPSGTDPDPLDVFARFLDLAYIRHKHQSYTLSLCYNHGIAAVCHHRGFTSDQFAALAVLADYLFAAQLKEACDVYLSFMGNYDYEQLRFARRYSLRRLFDKVVRVMMVNDPVQLEASAGVTVDEMTTALINRDAWEHDQCFRFTNLVRQAARLSMSPQALERRINDDVGFRISFTEIGRLRLLLRWCEICYERWDPIEMLWHSRSMSMLKRIRVDECAKQCQEAKIVLRKIEIIIDRAHCSRKEADRTAVKLEF